MSTRRSSEIGTGATRSPKKGASQREARPDLEQRFLDWARRTLVPLATVAPGGSLDDLSCLGDMIGDARIVAFGEGIHCAAEPLQFRNRLLEYLVRKKGYTAIAIESGIVESRVVHDYVLGGEGELSAALEQGIGWTFDSLPQNAELIRWLRQYNLDAGRTGKVNFYGFDVPGSAGNPRARRGVDTAVVEALRYLQRVDPAAAAVFDGYITPLLASLRFDPRSGASPGYEQLSRGQRDALTSTVAELVIQMERKEARYTALSSAADYEWGYRAAIGARQVDNWLRQIPLGWRPAQQSPRCSSEHASFLLVAEEMRDRAQADNLEWIVRQEGATGKVLIFAHRYHLSATPVKRRFADDAQDNIHEPAGAYLRRRFGTQMLSIGNCIGGGETGCGEYWQKVKRAPRGSIDGVPAAVGVAQFLLDLRRAPASVAPWLDQERSHRYPGQTPQTFKLAVGRAFDVLLYLDTITPACASRCVGAT